MRFSLCLIGVLLVAIFSPRNEQIKSLNSLMTAESKIAKANHCRIPP